MQTITTAALTLLLAAVATQTSSAFTGTTLTPAAFTTATTRTTKLTDNVSSSSTATSTVLEAKLGLKSNISRTQFLKTSFLSTATAVLATSTALIPSAYAEDGTITLPSGVSYTVVTAGDGPKPEIGELAAIRFKANFGDTVIDDIFDTPEPYYTRVGSGGLLKGIEEVIPKMRLGDRWVVTIPGDMAFGKKGRPVSFGIGLCICIHFILILENSPLVL